jgi:hypothetical protein
MNAFHRIFNFFAIALPMLRSYERCGILSGGDGIAFGSLVKVGLFGEMVSRPEPGQKAARGHVSLGVGKRQDSDGETKSTKIHLRN